MQLSQRDQHTIERERKKAAAKSFRIGDSGKKMGGKDDQFVNFLKKMAHVQEQMAKQQEQTSQMIQLMMQFMNDKDNNCRSASNNGLEGSHSNSFGSKNQSNKVMRPTQPTFLPKHGPNNGGEKQSLVEGDINASMEANMQIDLEIRH